MNIAHTFLILVCIQAAHSIEEVTFGLYRFLPPFQALGSAALPVFATVNVLVVALGVWCYRYPVNTGAPSAIAWLWGWCVVELANGIGHPTWSLLAGRYVPGTFTAPMLFATAAVLAWQLTSSAGLRAR